MRVLEERTSLWHSRDVVIALFFLIGIVIGSFLNVCISRIPLGMSVVSPASHCPRCEKPIKPYDNIPVLGWFLLRGKCRSCGLAISPMYPIIEFLTGVLFVACYLTFDITLLTFKWILFSCLIVVLAVTDLRDRILPDAVNWPGFGLGLAFATRIPPQDGIVEWFCERFIHHVPPQWILGVLDALLGAAFGSFMLWAAATGYKLVRKREGMGMGDVKMMAMVGTFLGLRGAFLTILFGALMGSVIGVLTIVILFLARWKSAVADRASRRGLGKVNELRWTLAMQYQLPLGTFLGVGALLVVFVVPLVENQGLWPLLWIH
jgi:leader peptidase (prepilin peptidase)/N-methyltransferase